MSLSSHAEHTTAAAGLEDGAVVLYDAGTAQKLAELRLFDGDDDGETLDAASVVGVAVRMDEAHERAALVAATATGGVAVQQLRMENSGGGDGGTMSVSPVSEAFRFSVKAPVAAMAATADLSHIAVGGHKSDLSVHDVSTGEQVFKARLPKFTWPLPLPVPYVASAAFVPLGGGCDSHSVVAVGTGSHEVRLYDARASRRPQWRVDYGECRVGAVCAEPMGGPPRIFAATGAGAVGAFDIRAGANAGALLGGYKGAQGGVRCLARHPTEGWLAAGGLDRWLRIYDANTRKLRCKVFMKQSMSGVGFDVRQLPVEGEEEGEEGGDGERNGSAGRGKGQGAGAGRGGSKSANAPHAKRRRRDD